MQPELIEVVRFLKEVPPFNVLPEAELNATAAVIEIRYFRNNTEVLKYGEDIDHLFLLRSGAVEVYRRNGELYNRLESGGMIGQLGLLINKKVKFPVKTIEDSLFYCLPSEHFFHLCDEYEAFADFVEVDDSIRLHNAVAVSAQHNDFTSVKASTLLYKDPVILSENTPVQNIAQAMTEAMSTYALLENESDNQITGMITEHDLCSQIVAQGLSGDTPARMIMQTSLYALDHHSYLHEVMMTMLHRGVHHVPIMKNKKPLGVIEMTDLIRHESQSSLLLIHRVLQAELSSLAELSKEVRNCFTRMVNEDANSHMIGNAMSVIGKSFKQRLLQLAEETLGEPPIKYCFLALGSMARDEQLLVTDQDNALILDDTYDPVLHEEYFRSLAKFVSDGLAACGYPYCSGEIMATNPLWRKTKRGWQEAFAEWIEKPDPQHLLNCSIFFDLEGVWGEEAWAKELNQFILDKAQASRRFLACLSGNAIKRTPPLGFFKNFVMEKDGKHNNSINLKRRGTAPIVDLVRVHALAVGSDARNTFERLEDIIAAGILPEGKGKDLRDAMEFISMVRIRHQARDVELGIDVDNNIEPESLSDFDRRSLKDAFLVLSNAQNFIKYRYASNVVNAPQIK